MAASTPVVMPTEDRILDLEDADPKKPSQRNPLGSLAASAPTMMPIWGNREVVHPPQILLSGEYLGSQASIPTEWSYEGVWPWVDRGLASLEGGLCCVKPSSE